MPSYVTPKKNTAFIFYCGLVDQSDVKKLKANPTLADGDVQVSVDGGASANLTTLPTVTPASGTSVKVSLSADEMNGDNIVVTFRDQLGAEWCDLKISIQTTLQQIDDLTGLNTTYSELTDVPGASATIPDMLRWLYVLARNKITQSNTTQSVRNDSDSATIGTAQVSDDGATATRGKYT